MILSTLFGVVSKLETVAANYDMVKSNLETQKGELDTLTKTHKDLTDSVALDLRSATVVQQLFDSVADSGYKFIENLINSALITVFPERDFTVKIETGIHGSQKTVKFVLNDGVCDADLHECSGAVQTVVSVILRVYYIVKNNLRRVVILDESFYALHINQVGYFIDFLKNLVRDLKFEFLWVTQNHELLNYIDNVYEISQGACIKKTRES